MPPKKKASEVAAPSATILPPPEQTGGGVVAGGGAGAGGGRASSPGPKTRRRKVQHLHIHRTPPRRCRIDSATILLAPYSRWNKAKLVGRGTLKANIHVNTLARTQCRRLDEMLLLLTLLEV